MSRSIRNHESFFVLQTQSYGGFITTHVIGLGSGTFKCGIAVALCVDQRYYGKESVKMFFVFFCINEYNCLRVEPPYSN